MQARSELLQAVYGRAESQAMYGRVESTAAAAVTTFNDLPSNPEMQMQAQLQASQLWESSGFSQREVNRVETNPPHTFYDGGGDGSATVYTTGIHSSNVDAHSIQIVNRECKKDPEAVVYEHQMVIQSQNDGYNEGQLVPTWISSAAAIRQHMEMSCLPRDLEDPTGLVNRGDVEDASYRGGAPPEPKWCPICAANGSQCLCGMSMHAGDALSVPEPAYTSHNYVHWLTIQSIINMEQRPVDPQHREEEQEQLGATPPTDGVFIGASQTPPAMVVLTETRDESTTAQDQQPLASQQRFVEVKEANHPHTPSEDDAVLGSQGTRMDQGAKSVEAAWEEEARQKEESEMARYKAMIVAHPLYLQLLDLHASCLRIGTPVDQLRFIDMQMERFMDVTNKYASAVPLDLGAEEQTELDEFMTQYVTVISAFKDHLQQHVYTDVAEAMMSCWELEQGLSNITGQALPLENTGATMSDSDSDYDIEDAGYEPIPLDQLERAGTNVALVSSETDRSLMERVRQDLKQELQEGYRAKIEDVREEILRKRRAGKLPDGTTNVLKAWWNTHSKWPYPTEEEKEGLIQETGLELKQVNNWFINQRKRNWQSNPLAASSSSDVSTQRIKRKSVQLVNSAT